MSRELPRPPVKTKERQSKTPRGRGLPCGSPRSFTACGQALKQIAELRKPPRTPFVWWRPERDTTPDLSRKALINSTLLAFDKASVIPATNSGIDFGRPLLFQRPDLPEIGSPEFLWLCLPKTISGMTHGLPCGNEAADGRVSDPAAACYPVAVRAVRAA